MFIATSTREFPSSGGAARVRAVRMIHVAPTELGKDIMVGSGFYKHVAPLALAAVTLMRLRAQHSR